MKANPFHFWNIIGYSICVIYFSSSAIHPSSWHMIDGANLIIHEAGHPLFSIFGQTVGIAGGTILQLLIPCLFALYFYRQQETTSFSVMLLWIGQSLINVSVYLGDAVSMQLPLLGGDGTIHDWNYLLGHMGALQYTSGISHTIFGLGVATMIVSIGYFIRKEVLEPLASFS